MDHAAIWGYTKQNTTMQHRNRQQRNTIVSTATPPPGHPRPRRPRPRPALGLLLAAALTAAPLATATAGVTRNADGNTVFTPSGDTRTIYVSSSQGNDSNSGLSPDAPLRSIEAGKSLLRDGNPDWLLLKRGDQWQEGLGNWLTRGRNAQEPIVVGAYGSGDKPLLRTGDNTGLNAYSLPNFHDIAFTNVHLQSRVQDREDLDRRTTGVRFLAPGKNVLFEGVTLEGYSDNMVLRGWDQQRTIKDVSVRNSVIIDSYSRQGHSQGIYASKVENLTIEGNVIDHNGFNPAVQGAGPTIFNHNLYIRDAKGLNVRGNIISRGSSHGLQARTGGEIDENLFVDNAIAFIVGGNTGGADDNVVIHASDRGLYPTFDKRQWGIDLGDIKGLVASENIIAQTPDGNAPLKGTKGTILIDNIVHNWGTDVLNADGDGFPDPDRTLYQYDQLLGGDGTIDNFLENAREFAPGDPDSPYDAQSVIDYFREGYGLETLDKDYDGPQVPDGDDADSEPDDPSAGSDDGPVIEDTDFDEPDIDDDADVPEDVEVDPEPEAKPKPKPETEPEPQDPEADSDDIDIDADPEKLTPSERRLLAYRLFKLGLPSPQFAILGPDTPFAAVLGPSIPGVETLNLEAQDAVSAIPEPTTAILLAPLMLLLRTRRGRELERN